MRDRSANRARCAGRPCVARVQPRGFLDPPGTRHYSRRPFESQRARTKELEMPRREAPTLLSWIVETGEARLLQFAEELLANPKMAEAFSAALGRAAKTKGQVDRNMQMLLGLLNMPSKADYNRLLSKIEA